MYIKIYLKYPQLCINIYDHVIIFCQLYFVNSTLTFEDMNFIIDVNDIFCLIFSKCSSLEYFLATNVSTLYPRDFKTSRNPKRFKGNTWYPSMLKDITGTFGLKIFFCHYRNKLKGDLKQDLRTNHEIQRYPLSFLYCLTFST